MSVLCCGFLARTMITWFTVVNQMCPYVAYHNAAYYVCSLSLNEECLGIATLPLCSDSGNPSITKYDSNECFYCHATSYCEWELLMMFFSTCYQISSFVDSNITCGNYHLLRKSPIVTHMTTRTRVDVIPYCARNKRHVPHYRSHWNLTLAVGIWMSAVPVRMCYEDRHLEFCWTVRAYRKGGQKHMHPGIVCVNFAFVPYVVLINL